MQQKSIDQIDMLISEATSFTEILLHIAEEASADQRQRLRPCAVAMLYIELDRLRLAQVQTGRLAAACAACRATSQMA